MLGECDPRLVGRFPGCARGFAIAERRRRRGPLLAVAVELVRSELGAAGDQRGQVGHGLDGSCFGDPDQAVRVEVVAEQQRGVAVCGSEESRRPVVQQVALVNRLEAERVPLLGQRREDGLLLTLGFRAQRVAPERALACRLRCDGLPETRCYSQPASSFVQYETTRSAPARTIAVSDSSAAARSSIQPRAAEALSIAYSPETL